MGIRRFERSIAKARLAEMGVEHINKRFSFHMSNAKVRKLQKRRKGRSFLDKILAGDIPVWRRILYGDLAGMYMKEHARHAGR